MSRIFASFPILQPAAENGGGELTPIPGSYGFIPVGPGLYRASSAIASTTIQLDAANEAVIFFGYIATSDGGSHTINTTGSSSIQWRTAGVTFADGGTTAKVGLAPVDTASGPPGRASNAADVISFDVSRSMTGGGGGITANAWQSHVPDSGSKTIANGDLVAFAVQLTARAGADVVNPTIMLADISFNRPAVTSFTGGAYSAVSAVPDVVIVFNDGALGWFHGAEILSTVTAQAFNSGSGTNEYGQLFDLPFPYSVYGAFFNMAPASGATDVDVVLYSSPLTATPVNERTTSIDGNTCQSTGARRVWVAFSAPYDVPANTQIAIVIKPTTANNITIYFKTLNSASHRIADVFGTSGFGVIRGGGSGAFADKNSSLDQIYCGLLIGAFNT